MAPIVLRGLVFLTALGAVLAAFVVPERRRELTMAAAFLSGAGAAELFARHFERFVGLRYLHRTDAGRAVRLTLLLSILVASAGLALFLASRDGSRALQTFGVVVTLLAALVAVVCLLLRTFSVFTTVSTIGVILGVASLLVVLAVTSGFEREFQDKVLGLNAHLIVIPYGNVDVDSPENDAALAKLRGMPGTTRAAKFIFSAGEVMVGKVGANLKGLDLEQGADDLRGHLVQGSIANLDHPARCPIPEAARVAGGPTGEPAGRIVLGSQLAHRLRVKVGGCVSVMIPFASGVSEPPAFRFYVAGLFHMGFNEYDTRLAYVSLADARKLGGARALVVGVELRFADPMRALGAVGEVQRRVGDGYRVIHWRDLNRNLFEALTMQKLIISLLLMLIIVVAAFNIIASLTMIVLSKVREIAILKSMGARNPTVSRLFLVGGITVGAVGTMLGVAYGLLVCGLARLYGYELDPKVYLIGMLPVRIDPAEIVLVTAATLTICFFATLYPSVRASRLQAVEGLRYD